MRIVSLLPSATEIVLAIGLHEELIAVTHECDFPEEALKKYQITSNLIDHVNKSSAEIDRHIKAALHNGSSIYGLDQDLLERLSPDLILTQELCDVCAVAYNQVQKAVRIAKSDTTIASLEPTNVEEILESIMTVGRLTGHENQASLVVGELQSRIEIVTSAVQLTTFSPRVLCVEWLDPLMVGGHWVPDLVRLAGGIDGLGQLGKPSFGINPSDVVNYQPEVIVFMPCGFHLDENLAQIKATQFPPEWDEIPAVKLGNTFAVDGSSFFNRPGPRVVDGLELLANILHPELQLQSRSRDIFHRVSL